MKKLLLVAVLAVAVLCGIYFFSDKNDNSLVSSEPPNESVTDTKSDITYTEKYAARVDRVDVVFEHKDYTQYRLTTNGLVREGELNTERGFQNDPDATIFVLNWRQPEGQQIYYVKLTSEPNKLYALDSNREIINGSALTLVEGQARKDITGFAWIYRLIDENADIPKSEVSLSITREGGTIEAIKIATVEGSCNEMPVDTVLALGSKQLLCYFAGFGYQFRVLPEGQSYVVQQREIEEASPDYNPPIAEFKTIMKID